MLALALPLGLVIGLSLGALGGGGSILTVPALVYVLGQEPRTATTSSLLIVGVTSLIGLIPHFRAGRVRVGPGLVFGLLGTAGSFAGSRLSVQVSPPVLLAAFAILMLVVAGLMVRSTRRRTADTDPADTDPADTDAADTNPVDSGPAIGPNRITPASLRNLLRDRRRVVTLVVTATAVGLLTGFFGVGGGFALVPALVLVLDFPMPVAIGTSLLVIAVNSATALAARAHLASALDWSLIATFTGAAVVGSLLGGRAVGRVSEVRLRQAFVVLLVLVALYTGVRSIGSLV